MPKLTVRQLIEELNGSGLVKKELIKIIQKSVKSEESIENILNAFNRVLTELNSIIRINVSREIADVICIDDVEEYGEKYIHIYAIKDDSNDRWGLELEDWCNLVDMNIDEKVFERYSKEKVLAELLWEITFFGYSNEEIQKRAKLMLLDVDVVEKLED